MLKPYDLWILTSLQSQCGPCVWPNGEVASSILGPHGIPASAFNNTLSKYVSCRGFRYCSPKCREFQFTVLRIRDCVDKHKIEVDVIRSKYLLIDDAYHVGFPACVMISDVGLPAQPEQGILKFLDDFDDCERLPGSWNKITLIQWMPYASLV